MKMRKPKTFWIDVTKFRKSGKGNLLALFRFYEELSSGNIRVSVSGQNKPGTSPLDSHWIKVNVYEFPDINLAAHGVDESHFTSL